MTRSQYQLFTGSCALAALLVLVQMFLTWRLETNTRTAVVLEQVSNNATRWHNTWQRLAARIYEVGAKDPPLRDILNRENISVKPVDRNGSPMPAPANAPASPTTPSTP